MKSDDTDDSILSILKKNARTHNVDIAKSVGLTEGAVRKRIENMIKSGRIERFTVEAKSGANFGIVMVKAKNDTKILMKEIKESKLAREAYEISGEYDGCIIIEGNTLEEIDSKIDGIRRLPDVGDTKTIISLKRWE
ncbi:Lrp/AsnC family transcriptional regulator [Candidatus Micrarchaeota archaeon]|nr:Lrp/AsnC family transcriptional regulator [Candidatus Micrarchaeota archaeon]